MHRKEAYITTLLFKLYALSKRSEASNRKRGNLFGSLIKFITTLAGFGFLTMAGFTLSLMAGLIVAGVSCFLLTWVYGSDESKTADVH